jgi:hypothetical protein
MAVIPLILAEIVSQGMHCEPDHVSRPAEPLDHWAQDRFPLWQFSR